MEQTNELITAETLEGEQIVTDIEGIGFAAPESLSNDATLDAQYGAVQQNSGEQYVDTVQGHIVGMECGVQNTEGSIETFTEDVSVHNELQIVKNESLDNKEGTVVSGLEGTVVSGLEGNIKEIQLEGNIPGVDSVDNMEDDTIMTETGMSGAEQFLPGGGHDIPTIEGQIMERSLEDSKIATADILKQNDNKLKSNKKTVTIAVVPKGSSQITTVRKEVDADDTDKDKALMKIINDSTEKIYDKPFQNAVLRCSEAIDIIYKHEYNLVKYGAIMRDEISILKFERSIFDLSMDTGGIHYHVCCSDTDGNVVIRYFEHGCMHGFVESMVDEIRDNHIDINPIPYSLATTEDVQKRIELISVKEQEKFEKWKTGSEQMKANRSVRRLNLGVNQLNHLWESLAVSLGVSEMNIYSAVAIVLRTVDEDPCFIRAICHDMQHVQNLIFLHKNNPHTVLPTGISPAELPAEPTLKEQMQFICTIPNNHYGILGQSHSLTRNISVPFPHDKARPASIRNKFISSVATNDKKYLFFAMKFYHDYRRYSLSNPPPKQIRKKFPYLDKDVIEKSKTMLLAQ